MISAIYNISEKQYVIYPDPRIAPTDVARSQSVSLQGSLYNVLKWLVNVDLLLFHQLYLYRYGVPAMFSRKYLVNENAVT